MKQKLNLLFLIIIVCISTGCTAATYSAPQPSSGQVSSHTENLSNERIPLREESRFFSFQDALPQNLPPQIISDDEEAYRLALTIRNYLFYGKNSLEDFSRQVNGGALETAIYHTIPLDLRYSYGLGEGFVCEEYPNHVITGLVEELVRKGKDPAAIFYADAVRATAKKLFGEDVAYKDAGAAFYEYFPEQDVYIQFGDLPQTWFLYPQITAYRKTDDGYTCEAILVWALDSDTPMKVNDTALTKDNFEQVTSGSEKYRYTFTSQQDGLLVLRELQTLS